MKKITSLLLILCITFIGIAQEQEPYKLTANDVEHFIENFPGLKSDLENLGAKYDSDDGEITLPEHFNAWSDFDKIAQRRGYKDHTDLIQKFTALMMAYASMKVKVDGKAEIERQLKEIEANDDLSAEQKQMMKQQLEASLTLMNSYADYYDNSANIGVVTQYKDKLDKLFKDE